MSNVEKVLYINFNQSQTHFVCCLESGVRVYNLDPLLELDHFYTKKIGTMCIAEMRYKSNMLALVAGGSLPKNADNVVTCFDSENEETCVEFTYGSQVLATRVCDGRVVAALKDKVHVFPIDRPLECIYTFETRDNPLGLLALTPAQNSERVITCFPAKYAGFIQIEDIANRPNDGKTPETTITFQVHDNELACISLNHEGTLLATASKKGTLIRVWDTIKGVKVAELRRGAESATVYCLNFSGDSDFLCCSSDKGTVHIFAVKDSKLNKRSTLQGMSFLGEYVDSQWAVAKFQVPSECPCICAFSKSDSVFAICYNGSVHKYSFTSEGHCNRESYEVFLDVCRHWPGTMGDELFD